MSSGLCARVHARHASGSRTTHAHGPAHRRGGWRSGFASSWRCQHDVLVGACALAPCLRQLASPLGMASEGRDSPDRRRRRSGLLRGCRARALGLLAATAGVACRLSLRRGLLAQTWRSVLYAAPKHRCSTHPMVMSDTGEASSGAHGGSACAAAAAAGTAAAAGLAELPPSSLPGSGPGVDLQRRSKGTRPQRMSEHVDKIGCNTQPSCCICAPAAWRLRR